VDRQQITPFTECLEDWICEHNPVGVIDVFGGGLDLAELHFGRVDPEATGRPHATQQKGTSLRGFCIERGRTRRGSRSFLSSID
jgi:hypothetical protein